MRGFSRGFPGPTGKVGMADYRSARRGSDDESIEEFMKRRNREAEHFGPDAVAAAHEAYGRANQSGAHLKLSTPGEVMRYGAGILAEKKARASMAQSALNEGSDAAAHAVAPAGRANSNVGHPGFAESLIAVWGSGREAVADFQDGDYAGAGLNGALAASDLFLAGSVAKGIAKGGFYVVKGTIGDGGVKTAWPAVRKTLAEKGILEKYQHGHHWLIPQNGWGKAVPDVIKNHPFNIKPMPSPEVHGRITGRYNGKPRFNAIERYVHGTPTWAKVGTGAAVVRPGAAMKTGLDDE